MDNCIVEKVVFPCPQPRVNDGKTRVLVKRANYGSDYR